MCLQTCLRRISKAGFVIFKHDGSNIKPTSILEACDLQDCSAPRNVTCNFIPDTIPPTNPATNPSSSSSGLSADGLAGVISGAVLGGLAIISVPVGYGSINWLSRRPYPIAKYVWSEMKLDTPNFETGNGQIFRTSIQTIIDGLKAAPYNIDVPSMHEEAMKAFCTTCLIPALNQHVSTTQNGVFSGFIFGKNTLNLEDLQAGDTPQKVVQSAHALYRQQAAANLLTASTSKLTAVP